MYPPNVSKTTLVCGVVLNQCCCWIDHTHTHAPLTHTHTMQHTQHSSLPVLRHSKKSKYRPDVLPSSTLYRVKTPTEPSPEHISPSSTASSNDSTPNGQNSSKKSSLRSRSSFRKLFRPSRKGSRKKNQARRASAPVSHSGIGSLGVCTCMYVCMSRSQHCLSVSIKFAFKVFLCRQYYRLIVSVKIFSITIENYWSRMVLFHIERFRRFGTTIREAP